MKSKFYIEIINKLINLNKKEYKLASAIGIQTWLIITLLTATGFITIEAIGNFNSIVRTVFFFIICFISIISFSIFFIYPLLKHFELLGKFDNYKTANKVGLHFPELKDDLINAMQLVSIDENKRVFSFSLIEAAFKEVYGRTKSIQFENIISYRKAKELLLYTIIVVVVFTSLLVFVPGLQASSNRILNFTEDFIPPAKFSFEIIPGNTEITKGEEIKISVKVNGILPKEVFLAVKHEEDSDFIEHKLLPDSNSVFHFEKSVIRSSFIYYAFAENIRSENYNVKVVDRPIIKLLDLKITPPAYSKLSTIYQKDNGNITSLFGASVEIQLSSTKKINSAELQFSDSTIYNLNVNGNKANGNFRIRKDLQYKIIIKDENGNENLSPISYNIKTLFDALPIIDLILPNRDVPLSKDNRINIISRISDDYGFTKLMLHYKLSESKYDFPHKNFTSIEIPINPKDRSDILLKEERITYVWNLTSLNLATEDVITYYLEIFDNDNVSGPKSAKTSEFNIRVPSLDELFSKVEETQQEAEKELMEVLKEAVELKNVIEKIEQELKKDDKQISWQEKEKIEQAMQKFDELQQKVEETAQKISEMREDIQKNDLLSQETMEKYMELQKLLNEFGSEEMKEAMEKLQKALETFDRKQVQEAMQNMKFDEEQFKASIERTMNLFKRIQVEQKIDELKKRTDELTEKQEQLQKETNESDGKNKDELAKKQEEISKEMERLEKELQDLKDKMSELKDMPMDQLEKAMEEFENQENQELSEDAKQEIQKGNMQQAEKKQSKLSKNMQKMKQEMSNLQSAMQQQNRMQTLMEMMKIIDNILNLSKQQEELKNENTGVNPSNEQLNENARKQNNIKRGLENMLNAMNELSQKTFAITPEMGKALGDARREMNKSLDALSNRNIPMASNSQGEAMKSLNEAATLMKGSMESMMQGGEGGGMMSLMQQLGQMAGQQMSLNNLTQMMQQGMQGQMSPEMQAQMQRLAAEQQMIQKSLQQLESEARESGKSKSLPANLQDILKQMEEVITDMKTEKLDDNLVQKQERILSKLLDAQRSLNERDYEKERESNTADNIRRTSPSDIKFSTEQGKDLIRDAINRAVQEGYNKDYEQLIRRYYELLQKENVGN